MGTDNFGRDLFSRVLHGARISLRVGLAVTLLSTVFGAAIGLCAAQFRSLVNVLMRIMDGLMTFPAILLAIAILAALGPRETNVILALTIAYVPKTARVVRGSSLSVRELDFVEAARALGCSSFTVMSRHILPQLTGPIMVQATTVVSMAILAEAGLSFIGVGVPPPTPSWGNILAEGRQYMYQAPWMTIFPGISIVITILGVNMLGDGIRDMLDPRVSGVKQR